MGSSSRKAGKSHWIGQHLPEALVIDFLKIDVFADYIARPALLRERYASADQLIVIDETQMVPDVLNEVHYLIENHGVSFLLIGSSPLSACHGRFSWKCYGLER